MDNRQKEIENLKDYKYGFSTDIDYYSQKKTTFITSERQYVSFFIAMYT